MPSEISALLLAAQNGDRQAASQLLPLVYEELRQLAAVRLCHEQPGLTLQPTALVHEDYLRLLENGKSRDWDGRGHFFAAAAEAMRRILIDQARRKAREKHGGKGRREELSDLAAPADADPTDLIALDDALNRLAQSDSFAAEIVKLRYFAGLSMDEVAAAKNISLRTAYYTWAYAKAWLHRALAGEEVPAVAPPTETHNDQK